MEPGKSSKDGKKKKKRLPGSKAAGGCPARGGLVYSDASAQAARAGAALVALSHARWQLTKTGK